MEKHERVYKMQTKWWSSCMKKDVLVVFLCNSYWFIFQMDLHGSWNSIMNLWKIDESHTMSIFYKWTHTNTLFCLFFPVSASGFPQWVWQTHRPQRLSGAQEESPAVMKDRSHKPPVSSQAGHSGTLWLEMWREESLGSASLTWENYYIVLF